MDLDLDWWMGWLEGNENDLNNSEKIFSAAPGMDWR